MSRWRITFWMNDQIQRDWEVVRIVETLKKQHKFTTTVRDGILLICDLRAGKTDVLLDLFPWVAPRLGNPPTGGGGNDDPDLALKIAEQLILLNGTQGYQMSFLDDIPDPSSKSLHHIASHQEGSMKSEIGEKRVIEKPLATARTQPEWAAEDDDEETLILKRTTSTDASQNFLAGLTGLAGQ